MTTRNELERRVDELALQFSGRDFAAAISHYSATLDEHAQEALKEILVERASSFDQAIMDRVDARGWFRRQWDRTSTSSPPGNTRDR